MPEELNVIQQIKIARASRAGVDPQKIADHLGVTLAQVNTTIAIDQEMRKEEDDFAAWLQANATPQESKPQA